jgi:hypothetical protein
MNHTLPLDIRLNDLQKEFYRLFRKLFPELVDKIKVEPGIIDPTNFCFSIESESKEFGKISFDIDDSEITFFSDFEHRHFSTYLEDQTNDRKLKNQMVSNDVIEYTREFVSGNIIIEFQQLGGEIIKSQQYNKAHPHNPFSATVNLKKVHTPISFIKKIKTIFTLKSRVPEIPITRRVNWFGEIQES